MAEQLDLTTPVNVTRTAVSVDALSLGWSQQLITATVIGSDGQAISVSWSGAAATTLMVALNKANLSVKSLQKRVLEQAVTDGKLPAGTVSGAPA